MTARAAILAGLLVLSAVPAALAAPPPPADGKLSGVTKAYIDPGVRPGDDFDGYANGAWRKTARIDSDRSSAGLSVELSKINEARNAEIIRSALAAHAPPGSDKRKIADYYRAYLDTAAIEARGLAPIRPALRAIASIKDRRALSAMLGARLRADTDPFNNNNYSSSHDLFGLFVSQDLNRPTRNIPYLMQGGLGLPDRDYYLSTRPETLELRKAYRAYVAKVFRLAGFSAPETRADRVLALETRIAAAQADIVTSEDAHKGDNPWRRADFERKAPGIDWTAFWTAAGLPRQPDFIAWQPTAVAKLSALAASEPLESWKDWLVFHRIDAAAAVLPKVFDDARFEVFGRQLDGTQQQRPRDKRALAAVNAALGDEVGRIYAARYFPASSKAQIEQMVRNIVAAFDARLARLDWMAPSTRAEARRKLAAIKVGIGYPDHWRKWPAWAVRADDPLGNLERSELAIYRYHLGKLGHAPDRDEWWMTPQTLNAVNLPLQNALNFPAAELQSPYFDPRFDAAANYGAVGAIIGHEISHTFDNLGSDFDATGRLRNWWTKADFARFQQAGKALAQQYDAYEPLPGVHLKGEQELGENIADEAGLTAAYEAYRASLHGRPAPVIDGLTGDQRFFLAFAQSWRSKPRERALRALIARDEHAPAKWRVETVRNLDAWYPAFQVTPGQALYLPPGKRVHVW